jgi:ATP-dependent DNA helicase RecG
MGDNNRVEYKREISSDSMLEKEVVAFLNSHEGGIIYIGIDNDGKTHGIDNVDKEMLQIKNRIRDKILPSSMGLFDISEIDRDSKSVIKITIASGTEKPYYIKKYGMSEKGCYIRTGSASDPMTQRLIDEMFSKRTRTSIGKIKSSRQDLSFEQLKIYYQSKGINLNDRFATNLELVTDDGEYNYVAYLMADKNNMSVKFAKYNGNSRIDLIENPDYGYESLIKATKQILDKIDLENTYNTKVTPAERDDERPWMPRPLREAILNAFVHNDYTTELAPKFEIFDDRIEITSNGGLPNGLNQDEFYEGYSVPRNKELMRIYKDLGLAEQLGSGIPRIVEHYGKECFKLSENFLRMSFPRKQIGGHIGGQVGSQISSLTDRQKEVLTYIAEKPNISQQHLADTLKINRSAVQKHINALKNRQIITREGGTRGRWIILASDNIV